MKGKLIVYSSLAAACILLSGCASALHQWRANTFSSWYEVKAPCDAAFYNADEHHEYLTCRDGRVFIR